MPRHIGANGDLYYSASTALRLQQLTLHPGFGFPKLPTVARFKAFPWKQALCEAELKAWRSIWQRQ